MGIDRSFFVKTDKGKFVELDIGYHNAGSRYFGMYEGELYDKGDWPGIVKDMLQAIEENGEIYYGHDHIEPKDYMLVTPELIADITRVWMDDLKRKNNK